MVHKNLCLNTVVYYATSFLWFEMKEEPSNDHMAADSREGNGAAFESWQRASICGGVTLLPYMPPSITGMRE